MTDRAACTFSPLKNRLFGRVPDPPSILRHPNKKKRAKGQQDPIVFIFFLFHNTHHFFFPRLLLLLDRMDSNQRDDEILLLFIKEREMLSDTMHFGGHLLLMNS